MNHLFISDVLWYSGHILTGSSIIFSQTNYYLAVSLVFFGQFITIVSRPVGRIKPIVVKASQETEDSKFDVV